MSNSKTIQKVRRGGGVSGTSSNRTSSAEEVICQIRGMIERGELNLGDKLPPERELAGMLGVSRPTLRAGIRTLAAFGALHSQQGTGTFIVEKEGSPELDSRPLKILAALHGFTPSEMFDARLFLEMTIAALAAERATGEQLASISEEIMGMFASLEEPKKFFVHDLQFHRALAAASGNRILTALMDMVMKALTDEKIKTVNNSLDLRGFAEVYHKIYRAVRDRNPELARQAMREQLMAERANIFA